MSHPEQRNFVERVKFTYPDYFRDKKVLEIGSYNINGTVRDFFDGGKYIGIDLCDGPCVDIVCSGHEYTDIEGFDTIITCEMMEHNKLWRETLHNVVKLLRSKGLFIMTCGTTGRGVHGTSSVSPGESPSSAFYDEYYGNLTESDIRSAIDVDKTFEAYGFETNLIRLPDLYFWGVKR